VVTSTRMPVDQPAEHLVVRRADLEKDRDGIVAALRRYLTPLEDGRRFDWLYRGGPWGPATAWVVVGREEREIVGVCSAFPRRVYQQDEEALGWVLGDFCISERHRSVGPALRLQRACLRAVDGGAAAFCYDFPSTRMAGVYRRLGVESADRVVRLARPLRVDRKLGAFLRVPIAGHALASIANHLLELNDWRRRPAKSIDVSRHDGTYGAEFSTLARQIGGRYGVTVQRTAEYLNWRYLTNPIERHEVVTARVHGTLRGWAAFTDDGENGTLVDIFGAFEPELVGALVSAIVHTLRRRGVVTVSVPLSTSHPVAGVLRGLGFQDRERHPLVIYPVPQSGFTTGSAVSWCLMDGDRDS